MPLSADDITAAFVRYERQIRIFCVRRLGDADAGEDAASATWLEFVRRAPSYEDRGYQVGALLYRIAQSRCTDYLRRQQRRPTVPLSEHLAMSDASDQVEAELAAVALLVALARLSPRQAQALHLAAAGCSLQQISAVMGVQVGAVKGLITRARRSAVVARLRMERA